MWRTLFLSPGARRAWCLILGVLILVTLVMALSPSPPRGLSTGWDKSNHLLAFASLGWAGYFSAGASAAGARLMALALLALGASIEVMQSFIPPRSGEWGDLLADALGIGLGLWIAATLSRLVQRP